MDEGQPDPVPENRGGFRTFLLQLLACLLVAAVILAVPFFALFIMLVTGADPDGHKGPTCRSTLAQCYRGTRMYLNIHDGHFPPAWQVRGEGVADDFSNLTYCRFLIQQYCADFRPVLSAAELRTASGCPSAAHRRQYERVSSFWKDTKKGWTEDYFAPDLVFRMSQDPNVPIGDAPSYTRLTKDVPSGERPLLTDVNASLPQPKAKDARDPGHEREMRTGFSFVRDAGTDVFIGVGPSLRQSGDYATSRFDFRHGGSANVLFLDGHAESVSSANAERLRRIHDRWNYLGPKSVEK